MEVTGYDGKPHQAIGVTHHIPVEKTIDDARGGRDEIFETALDELNAMIDD